MAQTGFLTRTISRVRDQLDEPDANAKWTDAKIIEYIETAYAMVFGDLNRGQPNPLLLEYNVTSTTETADEDYVIPPNVGSVIRMTIRNSDGDVISFINYRGIHNPFGQGIKIMGGILRIKEGVLPVGRILNIEYIPSGTARLHEATTATTAAGTITLAASPTVGTLGNRLQEYTGSIVRILGSSSAHDYVADRLITGYVNTTRVATCIADWQETPSGTVTYEIAPMLDAVLDMPISFYVSKTIASIEGDANRKTTLEQSYRDIMRSVRLQHATYHSYVTSLFRGDTIQNSRYY